MRESLKATAVDIAWNNGLPVYASEAFLRTVSDEYGWIGGTDDSGKNRCILPYTILRKAGLRVVRFRLATVPLEAELTLDEEKTFLNNATEFLKSTGVDMIMPGANSAVFRVYPDGADAAPYGTLIKDLTHPQDAMMKEIHSTFRYNIRRAIREGVQIKQGMEYLEAAYGLVADTLKRSGEPFRKYEDFKKAVLSLGDYVRVLVAEREGVLQGCMVAPFSQHTAYTWYCGSLPEPVLGSMHLLHWEAMCRFQQLGVQHFDFQGVRINPDAGSKQDGILNFKRRFGGELIQGFVWKYSFRPMKSAAYKMAVKLLHGGDIVDSERHKLVGSIA